MSKKDIMPRNANGELNGWIEMYYDDGTPYFKGTYHNGVRVGYWALYRPKPDGFDTYKQYKII